MSAASVTSIALAGVFGDIVGVRGAFLLAGVVIVAAAVLAAVIFGNATGRLGPEVPAAVTSP